MYVLIGISYRNDEKFLTYWFPSILFLGAPHSSARLQVGTNSLPWPLVKFRKLSIASINNCLDFVLWLFRYGHHTVQVFIHKQTAKHLQYREVWKNKFYHGQIKTHLSGNTMTEKCPYAICEQESPRSACTSAKGIFYLSVFCTNKSIL